MSGRISISCLGKIKVAFPELNIEWLRTGVGEMFNTKTEATNSLYKEINILPVSAKANQLDDYIVSVERNDCEKIASPLKDAELAITVTGESMSPEYPNGSQVLIKKINEKAFIDWGRTYVLSTCNGIVIKNVFPSIDNKHVRCSSVNSAYPNFEVLYTDIYGWYRVLMCMSLR
jgi:phage repressor protein C with HTH and peptisase S24 domain